jgi:hypothetical protein
MPEPAAFQKGDCGLRKAAMREEPVIAGGAPKSRSGPASMGKCCGAGWKFLDRTSQAWHPPLVVNRSRRRSLSGDRRTAAEKEPSMSLATHLAELERKHRALDTEIEKEQQHAHPDDDRVTMLKRRKLQLKDENVNLKGELVRKTIH